MIHKLCPLVNMKTVFFASECVELCDVTTVYLGHSRLVRKLSQVPYLPHETFSNIDVQFSGVVNFSRLSPYQSNSFHIILLKRLDSIVCFTSRHCTHHDRESIGFYRITLSLSMYAICSDDSSEYE
jgi:hypothetical protein